MRMVVADEFDKGCACGTCATGGRVGSVMCRVKGSNVAGAVRYGMEGGGAGGRLWTVGS